VLKILQFCDYLGFTSEGTNRLDITQWQKFVSDFYSPTGVMRQTLRSSETGEEKQFEISTPVLARYYQTLFESGIKNIQLVMENAREREIPNTNIHVVESHRSSFIHWFPNGTHIVHTGSLRVHLNANSQFDIFEFVTNEHKEYVSRASLTNAPRSLTGSPDQKSSPRANNRTLGKKLQPQHTSIPDSLSTKWGMSDGVVRVLEVTSVDSSYLFLC